MSEMHGAPLVLSLFPGIGLLDRAFEEEGFCVVRGPDLLWGGDIRSFHVPAGRFDGVIGGPPCQIFSILKRLNPLAGEKHGNMIPEFERVVAEAVPSWFVMENVEGAPLPDVSGYGVHAQLVRDVWVGGETTRLRRFSFGTRDGRPLVVETLALHQLGAPAALAGGSGREVPVRLGGSGRPKRTTKDGRTVHSGSNPGARASLADANEKQGWPRDFLADAPFTESGKKKMIGNGVPRHMGLAVARAVKRAMGYERVPEAPDNSPRLDASVGSAAASAGGESTGVKAGTSRSAPGLGDTPSGAGERERLARMADERASQIEGAVHRVARHMNLTPEEQASERALFQVWEGGSTSMREAADWRTIAAIVRRALLSVPDVSTDEGAGDNE